MDTDGPADRRGLIERLACRRAGYAVPASACRASRRSDSSITGP